MENAYDKNNISAEIDLFSFISIVMVALKILYTLNAL